MAVTVHRCAQERKDGMDRVPLMRRFAFSASLRQYATLVDIVKRNLLNRQERMQTIRRQYRVSWAIMVIVFSNLKKKMHL